MANFEQIKWLRERSPEELHHILTKANSEWNAINSLEDKANECRRVVEQHQRKFEQKYSSKRSSLIIRRVVMVIMAIISIISICMELMTLGWNDGIWYYIMLSFLGVGLYLSYLNEKKLKKRLNILKAEKLAKAEEYEEKIKQQPMEYIGLLLSKYDNPLAIKTIISFIENGNGTNWQELANLYDTQVHRWTLEDNSKRTLEENENQTALLGESLQVQRQTRNWAAAGAIFSGIGAAGVWKINSKL